MMKIAVAGTGYVGMSIATLLSQHHRVIAVDVLPEKVEKINRRISPIQDEYIEKYLTEKNLDLTATLDGAAAYAQADFVVIAAPTNYDPVKNFFDTSHVEEVIELVLKVNPEAVMVIKSTVPVGYTKSLQARYPSGKFLFSPEFLRESKALYDNLYPSRIIVGFDGGSAENYFSQGFAKNQFSASLEEAAHTFAAIIKEGAIKEDVPVLFMGTTEAEAVKLFANTYLALRVSFFWGSIPALALIITILPSVMAATACPRTPSSCWPTSTTCRKTLSRPLWTATARARITLPTKS